MHRLVNIAAVRFFRAGAWFRVSTGRIVPFSPKRKGNEGNGSSTGETHLTTKKAAGEKLLL